MNTTYLVISFVGGAVLVFIFFAIGFWIFDRLNQPRKTLTDEQRAEWFVGQFYRQYNRNMRRKEAARKR